MLGTVLTLTTGSRSRAMYLTNHTADKVKLAYMYVEHLRHNWRKLDDTSKDSLIKEISDLLNIQFIEQRFESKLNTVTNE